MANIASGCARKVMINGCCNKFAEHGMYPS
jgi:hypothetical protein